MEGPEDEASSDGGGGTNGVDANGGGTNGGGTNGGGTNGGGTNGGGTNGGGTNGGDDDDEYSFGLPGGDLSTDSVLDIFNALEDGNCGGGDRSAQYYLGKVNWDGQWQGRKELYQAAIAACTGDLVEARRYFASATINARGDCRLDEAIRSVLEQRPNRPEARCPASDFEAVPGCPTCTGSSSTTTTESNGSSTESTTTTESDGSTTETPSPQSDVGGSTSTVEGGVDAAG